MQQTFTLPPHEASRSSLPFGLAVALGLKAWRHEAVAKQALSGRQPSCQARYSASLHMAGQGSHVKPA